MSEHRLLVADDDPDARTALTWYLKEQGFAVSATDAAGAADQAGSWPDLVVVGVDEPSSASDAERLFPQGHWPGVPRVLVAHHPSTRVTHRRNGSHAVTAPRNGDAPVATSLDDMMMEVRALLSVRGGMAAALSDALARAQAAEEALARAREEAENRGTIVDILREVTSELSPEEIYRVLARRVARALRVARCSVVLARPGEGVATVATAFENPRLHNLEIQLDRYPEIRTAVDHGVPVLIEDVAASPLYADVRSRWAAEHITVPTRSAVALPFQLDPQFVGVFYLRTSVGAPPLTADDVDFAEAVIRASVAAIRRAQVLQTTLEDRNRLATLASTDPLTGALNRRALLDRLGAEIARARRYGTAVSLLMIDIDHFKMVNDTHGHLVGDAVLREVTDLLHADVRSVDIVARYGGEEFVVMLPETGSDGGVTFAERLRDHLASHLFAAASGAPLRLTASVGVASFPDSVLNSADELLARADEALYRAKADGRNLVRR
ncbi:MAG: hypothetical protein NVS1B4_06760 [Gemmatimonadaceae bacterium]